MFILNSRFLGQNLTGVQRYAYELLMQLQRNDCDFECLMPNHSIKDNYLINDQFRIIKTGKNSSHIWEQFELPGYLKKKQSPLLLNLCNTAPLFYKNKVVTIHDVSFERGNWHSNAFKAYYKITIPLILKNSLHIITVSEFSKQEIIDIYNIPADKITVIYNAPFKFNDLTDDFIVDNNIPYILSVGSLDARKNLKSLIKAFLAIKHQEIDLYLIGEYNSNFKHDEELNLLIHQNKSRIKFLGYVTDRQLKAYYKNAHCFVYPSLYEGFGLPPIEAMSYGCPVITSNVSSLPEVCGDAALYCNPLKIDDIADKIKNMISDASIREKCIAEGYVNAAKYSWDASGRKLQTLLNKYIQ